MGDNTTRTTRTWAASSYYQIIASADDIYDMAVLGGVVVVNGFRVING